MPPDMVYVTDSGMTLCAQCASQAKDGVLMANEVTRVGVLDGVRHTLVEEGPLHIHNVVSSHPADEPTMCWACLAMLAPR